ncbi:MAG: hypothetical protein WCR52_17605 [Bacteroidota bacterium]
MLTKHIGLIDKTGKISPSKMTQTAAALQKQATRDLGPIWGIQATVDYFPDMGDMPLGYWPIFIMDKLDDPNAAGYHLDQHHQPLALVLNDPGWQLTCSHEMCEMLVDPFGNRLHTANSIGKNQGRVRYLVEVCDPCEDPAFAYTINGVMVSDFYTPHYFDPVTNPSVRYSFTGSITKPLQVNKNGYLSWLNPVDGKWYQATFFKNTLQINQLQMVLDPTKSLRSQVDRLTKNPNLLESVSKFSDDHEKQMDATLEACTFMSKHYELELMKFAK